MTTTERVIDEQAAHEALTKVERIERAIDEGYEAIADSLLLKDRAAVEKHLKSLKDTVKQYLNEQGGELHDGEFDVTARLQERRGTPTYDLVTCVDSDEGFDAIIEAARAGMLRVDHPMLERFRKSAGASWADVLARYEMPGTGTVALLIERGK